MRRNRALLPLFAVSLFFALTTERLAGPYWWAAHAVYLALALVIAYVYCRPGGIRLAVNFAQGIAAASLALMALRFLLVGMGTVAAAVLLGALWFSFRRAGFVYRRKKQVAVWAAAAAFLGIQSAALFCMFRLSQAWPIVLAVLALAFVVYLLSRPTLPFNYEHVKGPMKPFAWLVGRLAHFHDCLFAASHLDLFLEDKGSPEQDDRSAG